MALPRFHTDKTALLVVDMQEKLLPLIHERERVERQCVKLIRGCAALGVPVVVSEQYPQGLGETVPAVRAALPDGTVVEPKLKFSAWVEGVRQRFCQTRPRAALVCGIESHVCVMQSVLDLISEGYVVGVVGDAAGSRTETDHRIALQRMAAAGAVMVSVEMVLFEMVHEAGTERFKAILPIVK